MIQKLKLEKHFSQLVENSSTGALDTDSIDPFPKPKKQWHFRFAFHLQRTIPPNPSSLNSSTKIHHRAVIPVVMSYQYSQQLMKRVHYPPAT
ncbi:hypothetical protein CDAR_383271 [Caerostris darwini]|uniref:Uncharacterized protein n=1 Tax=Caerostris darwini TaxID=1538125 RepID=A0AAV4NVV2_9ARAC|nr:hypothetical protein CDAR_383271 [Caerostris darwini]